MFKKIVRLEPFASASHHHPAHFSLCLCFAPSPNPFRGPTALQLMSAAESSRASGREVTCFAFFNDRSDCFWCGPLCRSKKQQQQITSVSIRDWSRPVRLLETQQRSRFKATLWSFSYPQSGGFSVDLFSRNSAPDFTTAPASCPCQGLYNFLPI